MMSSSTVGMPDMAAKMGQMAQQQFIALQASKGSPQQQISKQQDGDGDHGSEPNKGLHVNTLG